MRDVNRIPIVLNAIETLWRDNPDLRFFQLIYIIERGKDLFYMEDDDLIQTIEAMIKEGRG